MEKRFTAKVVLVTGAAHGIGRAIALRFANEGAQVVVNDMNREGAEATVQAITGCGGLAIAGVADVSNKGQVDSLFDYVLERFGKLDVLVNNAGLINVERHFLEGDEAWWDSVLSTNLKGVFLCSLCAAHAMARRRQGVIINMSSGGATRSHRGMAAYDASKGGIEALTRAMALDLAPYGIRVNALVPGSIDTQGMNPEVKQERGQAIPLGRMGEPEELAGPAAFLASDDASYITGHILVVDGGLLAQQRSPQVDIFPLSRYPKLEVE
ncbi:MAG TPA: SDR family NAD(P)-dependent oxidoreductase [Ktedonobacteraceae bacterium]|nr:SDR family NAD(P)-dependent oxidoreductase [Ktedonobacteraceae bacterium]